MGIIDCFVELFGLLALFEVILFGGWAVLVIIELIWWSKES